MEILKVSLKSKKTSTFSENLFSILEDRKEICPTSNMNDNLTSLWLNRLYKKCRKYKNHLKVAKKQKHLKKKEKTWNKMTRNQLKQFKFL